MKTSKLIIIGLFILLISLNACTQSQSGQNTQLSATVVTSSENIKVSGNCEMCKDRIEKAAAIDGVSKTEWDVNSKILILAYDSAKVSSDDVQQKIAAVGHDTEKYKADDKVYNELPGCCKYR